MVPFLGTLNIRGRIIRGTQKGNIILTTSQVQAHAMAGRCTTGACHPACPFVGLEGLWHFGLRGVGVKGFRISGFGF